MGEFLEQLFTNPAFLQFLEGMALKIIAAILHRRSTDTAFLAASDQAFAQYSAAKTDEERAHAQKALQDLLATPAS